jgi:Pretoxin HINT domain
VWEDLDYRVNKIEWGSVAKASAWSALGGIFPFVKNENFESITEACTGSFKVVLNNAKSNTKYSFTEGISDFISNVGSNILEDIFQRVLLKLGIKSASVASNYTVKAFNAMISIFDKSPRLKVLFSKTKWKCLLNGGCFTPNTPVYASNYNFKNVTAGFAMATMPAVGLVPIKNISLLDNVVAHKTVNAGYGITASTDIYTGITDHDPYTSHEQIQRDKQDLHNSYWNEVTLQEVNGLSTCKLALTTAWTIQNGYTQNAIIEMNLPEQGIAGPFRITSIKHILPQKIPESPNSLYHDFDFRPVTGIFTHWSDKVLSIRFESGDTLGVTESHPIYSTTHAGWRIASELVLGEQVLTYTGTSTIAAISTTATPQLVYNLEVKDLHNFLVGSAGVLVHNDCFEIVKWLKSSSLADKLEHIKEGWKLVIKSSDDVVPFFNQRRYFQDLMSEFRYKSSGFKSTSEIAENFKALDFFKQSSVVGNLIKATKAISMKTTATADWSKWKNMKSVKDNIKNLKDGLKDGIFWNGKMIEFTHPEIHIYIPKDLYSPTLATTWKRELELLHPEIKFELNFLENYIK